MAFQLLRAVDSSITKDPYAPEPRKSPHPSPKHRIKYRYPSTATLERYFIQPMDLCEPSEDILGYTQVCSLRIDELSDLMKSKLNTPVKVQEDQLVPSFTIRLWSRASGRYVQILPVGAIPYARGVFGPKGKYVIN